MVAELPVESELSPAAIALLEFTSDPAKDIIGRGRSSELAYVTSKDAYVWAAVAAFLADVYENSGSVERERLSDVGIVSALYSATARTQHRLEGHYGTIPKLDLDKGDEKRPPSFRIYGPHNNRGKMAEDVLLGFLDAVVPFMSDRREIVERINSAMTEGYRELLGRELISDPILEAGLTFAILSVIPFSMTRRTYKGRRVYLRVRAAPWEYEKRRRPGGEERVEVRFETARIARVIKTGTVAAFHEATKTAGDEPDE